MTTQTHNLAPTRPWATTLLKVNPWLLAALGLALVYHGSLLLSGSFKRTYDAYVHIFFADHYARAWFDHWDYRWYTGFPLTSYPPGSQQSIALLSYSIGLLNGFVVVQLCAILWLTIGMYRFSKIWVSEEAAGYAALLIVFSSSITETVHVFGQLPTTFSLGFLLNALPYVYRWMREGRLRWLLTAWVVNAATTAGHHVSTLFGAVFFVAPVIGLALVEALRTPLPDESEVQPTKMTRANLRPLVVRRLRRIFPSLLRAGVYGVGLVAALIIVVLPYWLWSRADPITQVSIPHASRDSFIENVNAGLVFWLIPYGLTILFFPYHYYKGLTTRAWPMTLSIALLMLLGTGGTTPIPKMILGGAFDVLTLDRFTFWATILLTPLTGELVVSMRHGGLARYLREQFGDGFWRALQLLLVFAYLLISAGVANLTQFRKFQPEPIDMSPIITFLAKDQHDRWRFMTLGFGDQMAWLSAQTTATSVDGNYHSARRLPEMTTTPVERLEGAKFRGVPGIGSLQQFLAVPEKYNLKFIFSNDQFYDPLLFFSGWHRLQRLENGIVVWEREGIPPLPEELPRKEIPMWQRIMWGTLPMTMLVTAVVVIFSTTIIEVRRVKQQRGGQSLLWRWSARGYGWIDQRLRQWSHLPDHDTSPDHPWQFWRDWFARIPRPRPAPPKAQQIRTLVMVLLGLSGIVWATVSVVAPAQTPQQVIAAYYDDLDFRRFGTAYQRLDPQTRPSYDQYLLELSVQGGLVASYGKLDTVRSTILGATSDRIDLDVETIWITALQEYPTLQRHTLVLRDGRWFILPSPSDPTIPPDTFFRQPTVAWHAQGRRRPGTGPTDPADVLDQPQVTIRSATLVRHNDRYSLVGEVQNQDADPADLTFTGVLFDASERELSRYNAQAHAIYKVLPQELVPFRIDFEGVAGSVITETVTAEFRPGDFTPPNLLRPVASFAALVKSTTTTKDLARLLAVQDVMVEPIDADNYVIRGRLFNVGTQEATIPQLLLTFYNQQGEVVWVEDAFIERSIRPQRAERFELTITPARQVERFDLPKTLVSNARIPGQAQIPDDALRLPAGTGYAAVRISVQSFVGGGV